MTDAEPRDLLRTIAELNVKVAGTDRQSVDAARELRELENILAQGPIEVAVWEHRETRDWLPGELEEELRIWGADPAGWPGSPEYAAPPSFTAHVEMEQARRRKFAPEVVPEPITCRVDRLREIARFLPTALRARRSRLASEVLLHARRALGVSEAGLTVFERRARARRAPKVAAYAKLIQRAMETSGPRTQARREMREQRARRTGS